MNEEYQAAIAQAKENLKDFRERGDAAIAGTWSELRQELFTPEEIAACDEKVRLIGALIKARRERGISQRKLSELSGISQPVIARIEKFDTTPRTDTLTKLLKPLGMRLSVVPVENAL